MTTTLDPFQTALLAELRAVVDEQAARRAPTKRRRPARWGAAIVAVGATGAVALSGLFGAGPAYAVIPGANGEVEVKVDRLEDAAGLQHALERAGLRADVQYLPSGMSCAEGRFQDATAPDPRAGFFFSFGSNGYTVRLEAGAIGNDQTLVIAVSRNGSDGVNGQIGVAEGAVAPCHRVPAATA